MDKNSIRPLEELLDSLRDIEGFPLGKDEDILALSDPPFYTACPNPYIKEFIEEYGKPYDPENDDYHREPFVGDVSEGKGDIIYRAHSYHTKVPYKAIMKFIEHYTNPGDIIFDGFCGSGMTGIAAQITGRKVILLELSPSATFISYNYNRSINAEEYKKNANRILKEAKNEIGWIYETYHTKTPSVQKNTSIDIANDLKVKKVKAEINYTIWSDIFQCPYCGNEFALWDAAIKQGKREIKEKFNCPHCSVELTKRDCNKVINKFFNKTLGKNLFQIKRKPVLINYSFGNKNYEKVLDNYDFAILKKIEEMEIPYSFPYNKIPIGDKTAELRNKGIEYSHLLFTKRNLWALSCLKDKFRDNYELFHLTSLLQMASQMQRWRPGNKSGILTGTIYIPSLIREENVLKLYERKINYLYQVKKYTQRKYNRYSNFMVSTQSTLDLKNIPSDSVDYIFTDPPFGSNLMYSELNFIWEAWLKIFTNNKTEAIINNTQNKSLLEYKELMELCFKEMYRILKPNRWITIEFHNSKASVWNAIQEAITRAGFIIAQVAVLNKQSGSFNQVSAPGAVKNDLVINAYKPKTEFTERFLRNAGENMEIDFIKQQLEHLPVQPNIERTEKMLYSKMLAHYVQNGFKIRYNSHNFYQLLSDNFIELDGYWFLDSQVKEYNRWKSKLNLDQIKEVYNKQQVLFISDEKSALTWLYHFLSEPKTYSDIYTAYQQVATTTTDEIPELRELLDNNFILENGKYRRPQTKEEKEETSKNRERELDRAFQRILEQARQQKGKIRSVRREALLHGFTKCYQQGNYDDILIIADKLHPTIIESSGEIMDFIDIARIKTAGRKIEDY